jgi:EpsI family protein
MERALLDASGGPGMNTRRALIAVLLLGSAAITTRAARGDTGRADPALITVPYTIGAWTGTDAPPVDQETERTLAADAVLHRTYAAEGEEAVGLYIAYYREQRPGVSVHSPLHCLPGTGWEPEDIRTVTIDGAAADSRMKRLIVRKNLNRAVVLYAYSVHDRLVANEVLSKLWLLSDRLRRGRGDAALVRIVVPVTGTIEAAERRGLAFTRDVLPYVFQLWS